ncbi:hypothetical protein [Granulicella arctica]|uniref:hypothetical protein n=1 Tax=Granulicella arctica TaxID=940613 RepID=UPI0021E027AC|nr:hypothetical protein [Granulicella arctica]
MPRIYMRFEWMAGWRVSFVDGEKTLPRTLLFQSEDKIEAMAQRGGALKSLADKQALEQAIRMGRGGLYLELSHPQLALLERPKPGR